MKKLSWIYIFTLFCEISFSQSFLAPDGLNFEGENLRVLDLRHDSSGYQILAEKVAYGYFHSSTQVQYDVAGNLAGQKPTGVAGPLEAGRRLSANRLFLLGQNTENPTAPWGLGAYHAVVDSLGAPIWFRSGTRVSEAALIQDTVLLLRRRSQPFLKAVSPANGQLYWQSQPAQWRQSLNLASSFLLPSNPVVETGASGWLTTLRDSAGQQESILLLNAQGQAQTQWSATQYPVSHISFQKDRVFTIEGPTRGSQDYGVLCAYDTTGTLLFQKDLSAALNLSLRPQDDFRDDLLLLEADPLRGGVFLALHKAAPGNEPYALSYHYFNASGQPHTLRQLDSTTLPTGNLRASQLLATVGPALASTIEGDYSAYWLLREEVPASALAVTEAPLARRLSLAPNPAKHKVWIKLPAGSSESVHSYRLYGLSGQMYQRGHLAFSGGEATLDLHELPPGSYILVLEAEEKRYRARVVVER